MYNEQIIVLFCSLNAMTGAHLSLCHPDQHCGEILPDLYSANKGGVHQALTGFYLQFLWEKVFKAVPFHQPNRAAREKGSFFRCQFR